MKPRNADDPMDSSNRRISLIVTYLEVPPGDESDEQGATNHGPAPAQTGVKQSSPEGTKASASGSAASGEKNRPTAVPIACPHQSKAPHAEK